MQSLAAAMAVLATAVAFVSLVILHVVSPEFNPSWRMVSAYADGRHGRLLSIMFAAWGLGSLSLAVSLGPATGGWMGDADSSSWLWPGRRGDGRVLRQESPATRASGDVHYPERAHRGGATDDNAATIGRTARPSGVDDAPHVDQLLTHGGRDVALMRSLSKAGVEHSTVNRPGARLPATIRPFVDVMVRIFSQRVSRRFPEFCAGERWRQARQPPIPPRPSPTKPSWGGSE